MTNPGFLLPSAAVDLASAGHDIVVSKDEWKPHTSPCFDPKGFSGPSPRPQAHLVQLLRAVSEMEHFIASLNNAVLGRLGSSKAVSSLLSLSEHCFFGTQVWH